MLQEGLHALNCMEHRGACGGDGISGDGAGVMTDIPWGMFTEYYSGHGEKPGVGMIFLPRDETRREQLKTLIKDVCESNDLFFLGWREVPVDVTALGPNARKSVPSIWQFFVKSSTPLSELEGSQDDFELKLYLVRRRFDVERKLKGLYWEDDDNEVNSSILLQRVYQLLLD